jgi:hypothetical protein
VDERARSAVVHDDARHPARHRLDDDARAQLADRREDEHVGLTHVLRDFRLRLFPVSVTRPSSFFVAHDLLELRPLGPSPTMIMRCACEFRTTRERAKRDVGHLYGTRRPA